jgi:hypothetical protein
MVSVLVSSAVYRVYETRSGQTKDYLIGILCFSANHASLRRKTKDCLAQNKNNVLVLDMPTHGLLPQSTSTKSNKAHIIIISSNM